MTTLDQACAALEAAKIAEHRAAQARIDAEREVLRHVADVKDEGSLTLRGQQYKAVVTYAVNRTIDAAALDAVRERIPAALFEQAIEYKPAIRAAGLRFLRNNEPDTYRVLAQAITAKPGKPSVRLELIECAQEAA
jgi:hypothetical protein